MILAVDSTAKQHI